MEEVASKLLDFNQPFDHNLFDQLIEIAFNPANAQQYQANQILIQIRDVPEMWVRADSILENCQNSASRFFGLQILEDAIKTRWKILHPDQRNGIKNYVVSKIIWLSSEEERMVQEKTFLSKLNLVLIDILKHEWPQNWTSFVSEIIESSQSNEFLCENNMSILKLLSEEIFEFSSEVMTTEKISTLKQALKNESEQIFQLCQLVLMSSQRVPLIVATLETLQKYLTWLSFEYILNTSFVPTLIDKFFPNTSTRNSALDCLTEVAALEVTNSNYVTFFQHMCLAFMNQLVQVLDINADFNAPFERTFDEDDCFFIRKLASFITTFLKHHSTKLETNDCLQALLQFLFYLIKISRVSDNEIFDVCLEYWHSFLKSLYTDYIQKKGTSTQSTSRTLRVDHYRAVLSELRLVLISRMPKPEEVLIVEDENGYIVRETTKDTAVIAQYNMMREALIYGTHLDYRETEELMLSKLNHQVDGSEWSWQNLNTLCWAIGSISGTADEQSEKRFLIVVIKDLLGLCEKKRGKDNKAVIASNIMYVVGQYPRFLKAHWKFLRTVLNKLFEFMHEMHPGVQDMACETFLKICQKCKKKFLILQTDETNPFIVSLAENLPTIISDLEPHQIHMFYESLGCILNERSDAVTLDRAAVLANIMRLPNFSWEQIMEAATRDVNILLQPNIVKEISKILMTNTKICGTSGGIFLSQLSNILLDMLNVYKVYSECISNAVLQQGEIATKMQDIRSVRGAKREVLKLLNTFFQHSGEPELPVEIVAATYIPPILEPILGDFTRCAPSARDPEVLALFATIINKLKLYIQTEVPKILTAAFDCTLPMLTNNFEDFPEHRIQFFRFLKEVIQFCFPSLFILPSEHQKLVVDSIVWAFKHTERNIADTGLEIMDEMLINIKQHTEVAQGFYQAFLVNLTQDIIAVMTDRLHKTGFMLQSTILMRIIQLVENGEVIVPLDPSSASIPSTQSNLQFLREFLANLIITSFPNLAINQIEHFINGLFGFRNELHIKTHLRDFLIQLKEFSVEDNAGLFREEMEAKQQLEILQKEKEMSSVPGLLKNSTNGYFKLESIEDFDDTL